MSKGWKYWLAKCHRVKNTRYFSVKKFFNWDA